MKKTPETTTPYKPRMRELRHVAVAERLALTGAAREVYTALAARGGTARRGIADTTIAYWFDICTRPEAVSWVQGALTILGAEGLVRLDRWTYQDPKTGDVAEAMKAFLLPLEEITSDRHFLAGLAMRMT